MHTELAHLPASKRRELELIQKILFKEFEDAIRLGTRRLARSAVIELGDRPN